MWALLALVLGAVSFNLFLCFVNTNLLAVSNLHVMACEVLIISIVFLVSYRSLDQIHLILLAGTVLLALAFASVRVAFGMEDSIDIKFARDLIIPIAFFLLGLRAKDAKSADVVVRIAGGMVLVLALFEYFFVDIYTQFFNVAKYYIARGTMEAKQALQSADLFISGMRPAGAEGGRNLFPFLGDHRASSLFLEPVSLGNFAILVFMWGLIRSRFGPKLYLGIMATGMALIVLADSRFGAYFCVIAIVFAMLPQIYSTIGAAILPLVALALLAFIPFILTGSYDPQHRYIDNGFLGRLVLSGQMVGEFDVWNWLGLKPPRIQAFDSGYAYIVSGIGVIGFAIFWYIFLSIPGPDRQFYTFRNLAAMYYGVMLCVSNSSFTIKTASLLWFLIGVLSHSRSEQPIAPRPAVNRRARAGMRQFTPAKQRPRDI
jgi:putative polymerase